LECGEEGFGQEFLAGEDPDEPEAVRFGVVHFDVVVAWIDHPEARHAEVFIDSFLENGIGLVIVGGDDLGGEPEFVRSDGDEGKVGSEQGARGESDLGTGRELSGWRVGLETGGDDVVQPLADEFVAWLRRESEQGLPVEFFLVRIRGGQHDRGEGG
jgi:hypothetical protein